MKTKIVLAATLAVGSHAVVLPSVNAQSPAKSSVTNVSGKSHIAINGYDPVAFFTMKKPVHGNFKITSDYQGGRYFFANQEHKALFDQNPARYAPQCGGYCAYGVSVGALFPVDISTWQVRNDKLYLNLNPAILNVFNENIDSNIAKAQQNWPDLAAKAMKMSDQAAAQDLVNTSGSTGIAIDGYDPVAFFTQQKAVHGNFKIQSKHRGATYFFANNQHKAIFDSNPDKYAPQCGGYCAFGVSVGALFPVDISTWQVRNDKLYLNLNPAVLRMFNNDIDSNIAKADQNWPGVKAKAMQ